jgi:two-component system response regulator GlrR
MSQSSVRSKPHVTRAAPSAAGYPARIASVQGEPPPGAVILLVDDDPAVLESLGRVLATEGWHIVTAAGGEEALEHLAGRQPDLMITDLCMADINGWDLLFHEKMQRPDLPIFVITALPPPAAGGADHFAARFFQKPLDLEALVRAIHDCLESVRSATPSS